MLDRIDELGDIPLRELYIQEKRIIEMMNSELNDLEREVQENERVNERQEECSLNECNRRLLKLRQENKTILSQIKKEDMLFEHMVKKLYENVLDHRSFLENGIKSYDDIMKEEMNTLGDELKSMISKYQSQLSDNSLKPEESYSAINHMISEISYLNNKYSKEIDILQDQIGVVVNKKEPMKRSIDKILNQISNSMRRRNTCMDIDFNTDSIRPSRIRRHSEACNKIVQKTTISSFLSSE